MRTKSSVNLVQRWSSTSKPGGGHLSYRSTPKTGYNLVPIAVHLSCRRQYLPQIKHRFLHVWFFHSFPQNHNIHHCSNASSFRTFFFSPSIYRPSHYVLPRCAFATPSSLVSYRTSSSRIVPISHQTKKPRFTSFTHNDTHHVWLALD